MKKKILLSVVTVIFMCTGYLVSNTTVSAAEKESSKVQYQYVNIDTLTEAQKNNIVKGNPSEILTNDEENYSFVYQKNNSEASSNEMGTPTKNATNKQPDSSSTLDRGSLMKTGDTGANVPMIVGGFLLFGTGIGLLTLRKRHAKQMLVLLAVLGGGSLLFGSSFAQASEAGSLKAPETVTVTKGTKETKQPAFIEGYTYVGYLHTSQNDPAPTPTPVEKGTVTVNYQDELGNALAPKETLEGDVGKAYTTEEKQINGYDFKEVIGNASGKFTKTAQTVTYKYTKTAIPAADVTVRYIDQDGKEVHASQTIRGNIGEAYDATTAEYKLNINGYTLDTTKLPTNASGDFSKQAQLITYVYTKEAEDVTVTIKFVDELGNPFVLDNLTTFRNGSLVPVYPDLNQFHMILDYNQQLYNQGQAVPDVVLSMKEGETYSLPEKMTFKVVDNYGNIISPIINSKTYDIGITDWESSVAPTNREGTLTSENVVVTYQLKTVYYVYN
ncbi:MucBP domain-containing protein [Listeria monocytogenes]|nr:MucBP domain-containing protein [Listeria monocytogenes]EKA2555668.1 MucBP domain-containing protein [Listeria monocytogenes]EKA2558812.1 MucBP domain-containing protein [Listeria monocytogenes]EKA2561951.1 MucBP domain-containing protein [Listeria monocytogenes]EKA2565116.1 MucBP domain-containing protein [Listeria monocytogenes]